MQQQRDCDKAGIHRHDDMTFSAAQPDIPALVRAVRDTPKTSKHSAVRIAFAPGSESLKS